MQRIKGKKGRIRSAFVPPSIITSGFFRLVSPSQINTVIHVRQLCFFLSLPLIILLFGGEGGVAQQVGQLFAPRELWVRSRSWQLTCKYSWSWFIFVLQEKFWPLVDCAGTAYICKYFRLWFKVFFFLFHMKLSISCVFSFNTLISMHVNATRLPSRY